MNTRTVVATLFSLIALAGTIHAQEDHLIENQRTNIIYETTWGDTYLGKYTSNNDLQVTNSATLTSADAYIGVSDLASSNTAVVVAGSTWSMDSLQIGSSNNMNNSLVITNGGTVEIEESFTVLGTTNGNALLLTDGGTLYMKSDFDAATEGFIFDTNGTLKVGGTLSNLDELEEQRNLVLTGSDAQWLRATNTVYIGANTYLNTLSLEDGANIAFTNLSVGSLGTTGNVFTVSGDAQATIASNLWVLGNSNSVEVAAGGLIDAGNFQVMGISNSVKVAGGRIDVEGILYSDSFIQFSSSGEVTAYGDVYLPGLDGDGTMVLTGENARWTNNPTVQIGYFDGGSTLFVESNALMQVGSIIIGSNSVGNSVVVQGDGKLIIEGDGSFLGEDNSIVVGNGGWLTFGSDISTAITREADSSFVWNTGGTVEFQGQAPIIGSWEIENEYLEVGTLFLGRGRTMILNGPNAYWAADNYNFHLGDLSSDNTLIVSNGASASFKSVSIGDFKEGGNDNLMLVSGNNTVVTSQDFTAIGGTMIDGTWHEGGNNNILRVEDGAQFFSPGAFYNRNTTGTSGLEIASGAVVDVDSYYQSSGAYLILLTDASGTNTGLLRANTTEFEEGARLGVDAVSELTIGQGYTNMIVESGTLIVGGVTNATTDDLSSLESAGGSLVTYNLWETNQNIYAAFTRRSISEGGGIDPDSMLGMISEEIDRLASEGNVAASNQVQILSNMGSDQERKLQMEQMYSYELPTYAHNQGIFGGIDQVRARGLSSQEPARQELSYKPRGAAGPHSADQGLQGWAKVYGNFGSRDKDDAAGFVDGYDAQTYGTVIGFDQAFGGWLFGLAGGYAGSTLEGDNGDESDGKTGYGILYANYGTNDWFGDIALAYGLTDVDNTSGTDFGVSSTTKASQSAFYIGGGYQFEDEPTGALLRPSLGLQTGLYDQDAYTESGNVVVKDVDAFDRWSAVSSLGASVIYPKSGNKVDTELLLRAYWLHEFNGDDEQVGYTLVGSDLRGQFIMRSPDQDAAQFGLGYVTKGKNGWQLRGDIDLQLSETFTSTTLSGALLYEF